MSAGMYSLGTARDGSGTKNCCSRPGSGSRLGFLRLNCYFYGRIFLGYYYLNSIPIMIGIVNLNTRTQRNDLGYWCVIKQNLGATKVRIRM